jgi:hypothetical protein
VNEAVEPAQMKVVVLEEDVVLQEALVILA